MGEKEERKTQKGERDEKICEVVSQLKCLTLMKRETPMESHLFGQILIFIGPLDQYFEFSRVLV